MSYRDWDNDLHRINTHSSDYPEGCVYMYGENIYHQTKMESTNCYSDKTVLNSKAF